MKKTFVFNVGNEVIFEGTKEEIEMAERWPSFVATEEGREYIRRMAANPELEAWETFGCQC